MAMRSEARTALSRVQLRECYVMQETADIFVAHLTQFAHTTPDQAAALENAAFESLEGAYGYGPSAREDRKPFVYQDGFAIIPVHGALLNRFGGSYGFATGYNYIRRMLVAALEDDDVQVIVFDIDSPGGEAAGCFELAEEIRASREIKPSLAVVDSLAASAGYAIPSSCTRMVATPSSKIGSIGVVRMHINLKGALEQMGVEITFVEAPEGGQKTAGNPFDKLSETARKDWQASVNKAYDDFVALVSENRGMDDNTVRETQARVFRADEALALRLIDAVKTPTEAVAAFMAELADDDDSSDEEDEDMKTEATSGAGAAAPAAPAAAAAPTGLTAEQARDTAIAAVREDRERMSAIKALPEAANRPKLADKLALDGLAVDQAKGILAVAAEEAPAAPAPKGKEGEDGANAVDTTNHLDAAMDRTRQPNIGAGAEKGGGDGGEPKSDADLAASILADQAGIVGVNYGERGKAA